jgi:hypothetical protein
LFAQEVKASFSNLAHNSSIAPVRLLYLAFSAAVAAQNARSKIAPTPFNSAVCWSARLGIKAAPLH